MAVSDITRDKPHTENEVQGMLAAEGGTSTLEISVDDGVVNAGESLEPSVFRYVFAAASFVANNHAPGRAQIVQDLV